MLIDPQRVLVAPLKSRPTRRSSPWVLRQAPGAQMLPFDSIYYDHAQQQLCINGVQHNRKLWPCKYKRIFLFHQKIWRQIMHTVIFTLYCFLFLCLSLKIAVWQNNRVVFALSTVQRVTEIGCDMDRFIVSYYYLCYFIVCLLVY